MKKYAFFLFALALAACKNQQNAPDATGVFEADEVIVPAEAAGVLRQFSISEGQKLEAGQEIGSIDCTQLDLQLEQLNATDRALDLKKTEAGPQINILVSQISTQESQGQVQQEQIERMEIEQKRLKKLVEAKAAPRKQLDDIDGQISVLKRQQDVTRANILVLKQQIDAARKTEGLTNRAILSEKQPNSARKALVNDQISRCKILNPLRGTVLSKYVEQFEMAAPGKALYTIANLEKLTLRAYFTGEQLPALKIGQAVAVEIAQGGDEPKTYAGTISWISDKAEFTPKSIQTRNERANLVYAAKIEVPNDGFLKIGMFGDVKISK